MKQIFPLIFVVILALGLFFVVKSNDRQIEEAKSSSLAEKAESSSIDIDGTTLTTSSGGKTDSQENAKKIKFNAKVISVSQKKNAEVEYPVTGVITAKRVIKYFYEDIKEKFDLSEKFKNYYNSINNDKTYKNNTVFVCIVKLKNSNSKLDVSSVSYSGTEIFLNLKEKKADNPDKKQSYMFVAVNVKDGACNAKSMQKVTVNIA